MKSFIALGVLVTVSSALALSPRALSPDFIAEINSKQSTWVAGPNFVNKNYTLAELHLMGSGTIGLHPDSNFKPKVVRHLVREALPASFDARTAWPQCESIRDIRNQGACGACWAFGAVGVMSDRLCIQSQGAQKFKFTPEEVLTCCGNCGSCNFGFQIAALQYWEEKGTVSGGDAGSNEGCLPFAEEAADHGETPACVQTCRRGYPLSFEADKHYGTIAYALPSNDIPSIEYEIFKNGPVVTMFKVYEDFYSYQSGVYQHVSGDEVGLHAVRVIGWGVEKGVDYWLIANSWSSEWGSEGGFFKFLKGQNHCWIENDIVTGTPRL